MRCRFVIVPTFVPDGCNISLLAPFSLNISPEIIPQGIIMQQSASVRFAALVLALIASFSYAQPEIENIQQIETLVQSTFNNDTPGGVVFVAHKDQIIYQSAIGVSQTGGDPLTTDSIFRIASVTKQFTAVAILQLVEQGKLNLDDDINKHIPEFDTRGDLITIKMLLNHTSGIRNFTSLPDFNPQLEATDVSPDELMDFFNNIELAFKPGTRHSYSNSGYALLGIIIERVSNQTYAKYMQEHIFFKAGMKRAFAGGDHNDTTGFATGHHNARSGFKPTEYISLTWPFSAGCIETTAADLHTWTRALYAGKIISPESLQQAHTITTLPSGREIKYGYGWDTLQIQGHPSIEHGGGIAGFSSYTLYIPSKETFVTILCNTQPGDLQELAAKIAAIAIGQPYDEMDEIKIDTAELQRFTGIYTDQRGNERHISIRNGRLFSQRIGGMGLFLIPHAPNRFMLKGTLIEIEFVPDDSNQVNELIFRTRARDAIWTRNPKPSPAKSP